MTQPTEPEPTDSVTEAGSEATTESGAEPGPRIPVQDRQLRQQLQAARFRLLTNPDRGATASRKVNESFERVSATFEGAAVRSYVPILVEKAVRAEFGGRAEDTPESA